MHQRAGIYNYSSFEAANERRREKGISCLCKRLRECIYVYIDIYIYQAHLVGMYLIQKKDAYRETVKTSDALKEIVLILNLDH